MLKKELEQKLDDSQNTEDLALILEEANRCKNIVANLLNFARQGKLKVTKINLGQLLSKIVKNIKANPVNKKIDIVNEKLLNGWLIEGDNDQLQQVFIKSYN